MKVNLFEWYRQQIRQYAEYNYKQSEQAWDCMFDAVFESPEHDGECTGKKYPCTLCMITDLLNDYKRYCMEAEKGGGAPAEPFVYEKPKEILTIRHMNGELPDGEYARACYNHGGAKI